MANMAATSNHPMERVKMLNMREEALLKRHLDSISTLEKKQLHLLAKDTINLRMELRAHRFRAMKTMVRQKGALQEFDEKWRKRKAAIEREQQNRSYLDESIEGDQSGRRSASSVYERLYQSAGVGYKCPAPPAPLQRSVTSIPHPTSQHRASSSSTTPAATATSAPPSRRLLDRRTPEPARHVRSPAASEPIRASRQQPSPGPNSEAMMSSSRASTSSSLSYASTTLKPRPPTSSKPPLAAARRASTYRRPSTIQRAPAGKQKDYMETLLQSIVGGPEGKRVAGERGGNGAEALLSKLESIEFNEYTDGSLAMEMRRLKRKSVVHGVLPTSQHPSQQAAPPPAAPKPPTRLHTAPPTLGVSERKQAQVAAAVAAATTWKPPVVRRAWRGTRGYDSDKALVEENEGLMKLHREGQRQEYEDVLRRVNAFLGKPTRAGIFLPRDCLSKEETILLNKVRPPRTRLKGAVKLVMFLNKTSGLKALTGGLGTKKTPLGSATSSLAPPSVVSSIPEVK